MILLILRGEDKLAEVAQEGVVKIEAAVPVYFKHTHLWILPEESLSELPVHREQSGGVCIGKSAVPVSNGYLNKVGIPPFKGSFTPRILLCPHTFMSPAIPMKPQSAERR